MNIIFSYKTRVTLALVVTLFFVMSLGNLLIYKFSIDSSFNQLRNRLMIIARTATLMVDPDLLKEVPLNQKGVDSQAYKVIAEKLRKIKEVSPPLKYIYIMSKTDKEGIWQFVVDPEPVDKAGRRGATSYPGDKYDASRFPEMLAGFYGSSADKKFMADEWGITLSGYAPILDRDGKAIALLGVDMLVGDVYMTQKKLQQRAIFVLVMGFFLSLVLGLLLSNKITHRIAKIVEATRRLAAEDLDYKVQVKGRDEIAELATSFNNMATSLSDMRKRLQDYFYRVVQSLVRILEAKDAYTKGHSDRVAELSEKIGLEMGFSKEKAELLRKAAQIHDIGKLVINADILNKKDKLTEEEWKIIREHPIVGEQALKPVLVDEDVLAMVRSHHERYDGQGYPDRIKGDKINIFAQIISVADAFDAMTSARAYRPALDRKEAIEELKRNSGSQFNTQVVKACLKVLDKE